MLEHVCFETETERARERERDSERERERGKYCATASDLDILNSEHKQKELQSNMGDCSLSNTNVTILILATLFCWV